MKGGDHLKLEPILKTRIQAEKLILSLKVDMYESS